MAGHSKWANLQRRESVQARKRSQARALRESLESVRYEGYGPGGAAIMVDCLTDDRSSVAGRIRAAFVQHGGQLGAQGSVSYLFNTVGLLTYPPGTDHEQLMRVALEAGAEDVVPHPDQSVEVLADPLEFDAVRAMLIHSGFRPASAAVTQRAASSVELCGESAERMAQLLVALEDLDEVKDIYSNVEIPDEVLARL